MWRIERNDELYHHGVKGQKWGKRRYQNQDGSLTPAGKERYSKKLTKMYAQLGRTQGRAEYYKQKGKAVAKEQDKNAKLYEEHAKLYDSGGKHMAAAGYRMKSEQARAESKRIKEENQAMVRSCIARVEKMNTKISKLESKSGTKLGKDIVDSILKENKLKGYNAEKWWDEVGRQEYNTNTNADEQS